MVLLLASIKTLQINKKFKLIFYIQFIATIGAIWYGVFTTSYGFINKNLKDAVMEKTANGYSLFKWANYELKKMNYEKLIILITKFLKQLKSIDPGVMPITPINLYSIISYSFYFKHIVILDVMFLAAGFVWRAIAGAIAINVEISVWLFLCTAFLALFLGFNKRRAELIQLGASKGTRKNLQEYSASMIEQIQSIVTANAVLSYALYTVLGTNQWMTLTLPYVLYGIFRYIYLIEQKGEGGAPDETLLKDWPLILTVLLYVLTAVAVIWASSNNLLPTLSQ